MAWMTLFAASSIAQCLLFHPHLISHQDVFFSILKRQRFSCARSLLSQNVAHNRLFVLRFANDDELIAKVAVFHTSSADSIWQVRGILVSLWAQFLKQMLLTVVSLAFSPPGNDSHTYSNYNFWLAKWDIIFKYFERSHCGPKLVLNCQQQQQQEQKQEASSEVELFFLCRSFWELSSHC